MGQSFCCGFWLYTIKISLRKKIITDYCCRLLFLKYIQYFLLFPLVSDSIFQDSWISGQQEATKPWNPLLEVSQYTDIVSRETVNNIYFRLKVIYIHIPKIAFLGKIGCLTCVTPSDLSHLECNFHRKRHSENSTSFLKTFLGTLSMRNVLCLKLTQNNYIFPPRFNSSRLIYYDVCHFFSRQLYLRA